ncbi:hypothetical protein E3N88_45637 [Mikania micrantha]|uniref:Integrase catalytic domain-containing protein n=1 Tax=Mikania micrantha TaxID=192012 RepID=A0A5N6L8S1_9ASTR|nr:hypothetical protein E3N88_45637 [Mikania micrantha]
MATFPNVAIILVVHLLISGNLTAATWCVARTDAGEDALQDALDYACGTRADCGPVQQSGPCFLPNTVRAHASYAFNSYYMHSSMDPAACDFAGTATVAKTDPSTLDEDGYHNSFGDGKWKLTRGSLIVARGKRDSKLYTTHPKISKDSVHSLVNTDMTELWHKRLGHMSKKGMSLLLKRNALSGVRNVHLKKCFHCLEGKQNRVTFKSHSPSRKERILDLVHFDFHALVERQTGKKLKCIRMDNGGEYIGPFDAYCREKGIRHQKSPPKTPQLNGLAERMNRTLAERVRYRVWRGKDVSYNHLRVFGCKAFVHIPKDERSKLDVKTKPCIFLGYGQDEFGYRLYDPVLKKLVRSRDVVFMEDQTLKDIENVQMVPQYSDDLVDLDPVPPQHSEPQSGDETQVDQQLENGDVVNPELPIPDMPAFVPLRRSTRDRHPSTVFLLMNEMNSLYENNTFELVKLPKGKRALKNKWVYKLKTQEHTSRPRYKARLVVKGFSQRKGIDFDEIFSLVVKMSSIRVILGLVASLDLEVEQMDVKTAFLHGDLDKEIYMDQPEGFQVKGKEDCLFNMANAKVVSSPLTPNFKLTDKDCPSSEKRLKKWIGPDIAHAVGVVSRFLSNPGKKHWEAVKWILKLGLSFGDREPMLVGYTDSDMAGNKDNMKSTSGYLMTFAGGAVSWQSRLQKCVALSTTEAEYLVATETCVAPREIPSLPGARASTDCQDRSLRSHCCETYMSGCVRTSNNLDKTVL